MTELDEPLCFDPIFRSYLWGGRRLKSFLRKPVPDDGIWAESWELVDHGQDQSRVSDGKHRGKTLRGLIEQYPTDLLGAGAMSHSGFPLLLKYLDCQRVLSIQVHPDDDYARRMTPPDLGKTEAWYVVEATAESVLYAGLKEGVGPKEFQAALTNGRLDESLHQFHPTPGDCIFIPAGTVHALGAGLIVAEIQQASDTTFRIFDWNRVDANGQSRQLHLEQAMEVIDFHRGPVDPVRKCDGEKGERVLVDCDKFRLEELRGVERTVIPDGRFQIVTLVQGTAQLHWHSGKRGMTLGETVLFPASCSASQFQLSADGIALVATGPVGAHA